MLITNNPDKVYFGPLVSYKGDLRPSLFQLGLIGSWRRKNSFSLYGSSMASIQGVYNYTFWSLFKQLKFSHNRFIFVLKWSNYLEHLCVMLRQKDLPMNQALSSCYTSTRHSLLRMLDFSSLAIISVRLYLDFWKSRFNEKWVSCIHAEELQTLISKRHSKRLTKTRIEQRAKSKESQVNEVDIAFNFYII